MRIDAAPHARELVRALLREALAAHDGDGPFGDTVRRRARATCDCAHGLGIPIERLLVLLKQEWRDAPVARRLRRPEAASVLDRVVTLCIVEFYTPDTRSA